MPLCLASALLYAGGIVLNDLRDLPLDAVERPERPLPAGRVSVAAAVRLAFYLPTAGLMLAAASGQCSRPRSLAPLLLAAALLCLILLYDSRLGRTAIGPFLMGGCRGLNFLLGASHSEDLGGPLLWVAASCLGLFVCGLTWISRSEGLSWRRYEIGLGWVLQSIGLAGLAAAALLLEPRTSERVHSSSLGFLGLLVLAAVAVKVNQSARRALGEPSRRHVSQAVRTGVLSLIWLNVGIVGVVRGVPCALAVAVLWLPAQVMARYASPT